MSVPEDIRLYYPLPIAKLYETMQLESEPRQRVRKLIDLYERTAQYLALVGLAHYARLALQNPKVEALRAGLERPSLGHWVELLKTLSSVLRKHDVVLLTAQPGRIYADDEVSSAVRVLSDVTGASLPKKIRMHHFLDTLVEFRNKKIGHGVLSLLEAKQVAAPLEEGLTQWLGDVAALREWRLLHVAKVEWRPPHFVYTGTNLSAGTSLYPIGQHSEQAIDPERVYLHISEDDAFLSLHPFFHYNSDIHLLYVYCELSPQGKPLLRCPYDNKREIAAFSTAEFTRAPSDSMRNHCP